MVFPEAAFLNCKNIGPNKEKKLSSMLMFVIFVWLVMEQNIILTGKKILETTVSTQFVTFQNTKKMVWDCGSQWKGSVSK